MKTQPIALSRAVATALAASAFAELHGATFTANFKDGQVPAGATVSGNAVVESAGGVSDSGTLKLNKNANSQQGGFTIGDLDGGGVLQTASTVLGPWSDLPGSSSPYTLAPTAAMGFHRVRQ